MDGMTRGEVAERADVNPETLRYYERKELIPKPVDVALVVEAKAAVRASRLRNKLFPLLRAEREIGRAHV